MRPEVSWIAMQAPAIRKLAEAGTFQLSLVDQRNLVDRFTHLPGLPD